MKKGRCYLSNSCTETKQAKEKQRVVFHNQINLLRNDEQKRGLYLAAMFMRLLVFALLSGAGLLSASAQSGSSSRPKLVVGIVIDQMRGDYLQKFDALFESNGFQRFSSQGLVYSSCYLNYAPSYTAPGHASIFTGTYPALHGIAGNEWFDYSTYTMMYCVSDTSVRTVGSETEESGKMSPKNLRVPSLGDAFKLSDPKGHVFAISLKDRGAIMAAGQAGNAAFWFDAKSGKFITSSFYLTRLPAWLETFNKSGDIGKILFQKWEPIERNTWFYKDFCGNDMNTWERGFSFGSGEPVFPYDFTTEKGKFDKPLTSPFGNELLTELAMQLIGQEHLGEDDHTDFLSISFSSTDYVGHAFGPNSWELADTYARLDKNINELMQKLSWKLGQQDVIVFITADHGVAPCPGWMEEFSLGGGRFNGKWITDSLNQMLSPLLGLDKPVVAFENFQVSFSKEVQAKPELLNKALAFTRPFIAGLPGVQWCGTWDEIKEAFLHDPIKGLFWNGYFPGRSGQFVVQFKPQWMEIGERGTTHGSPYAYDLHIPFMLWGANIPRGLTETGKIDVTDIAPTISVLSGINPPAGATGKPLPIQP